MSSDELGPVPHARGWGGATTPWDEIDPIREEDYFKGDVPLERKAFQEELRAGLLPAFPLPHCVWQGQKWMLPSGIDGYEADVVLNVSVDDSGTIQIEDASIVSASVGIQSVEDCLVDRLRGLTFNADQPLVPGRYRMQTEMSAYRGGE